MEYNFYYWGPLLFRIKINNEDLNKIKKLCKKDNNKDHRTKLAGILRHEYLINDKEYFKTISKYLDIFKQSFEHWYGKSYNEIKIVSAWVNFMKKNEYNPLHIHNNCSLSSVLYTQIPDKLKNENKKYIGTAGQQGGPGSINFLYGNTDALILNYKTFFPEEGDFFIFPGNLLHSVVPFVSNIERISVAANFNIIL